MPLNIYDKNGNPLGFIKENYPYYLNVYLVALTSYEITDEVLKLDMMKDQLAGFYGCKNLFGKVNEEKFKNIVDKLWNEQTPEFKNLSCEDYIKYLFIKNCNEINKYFNDNFEAGEIKGYILINIDKVVIKNNHLTIEEPLNYIDEKTSSTDIPLYAKIIDYPILNTDVMGIGEGFLLGADLSDFGGRNHTHNTKLNILSGNYSHTINLPAHIYCKKDMNIQLYIDDKKITKVFCDGVFYNFYGPHTYVDILR